jgi:TRAP-type mannitol/chloroaromatic compound transport system permease small subunit
MIKNNIRGKTPEREDRARNLLYKTSKIRVGISKLRVENSTTRKKLRVDILNIVYFLQKFNHPVMFISFDSHISSLLLK